jgi:acetoacetyl-CoA synthetase
MAIEQFKQSEPGGACLVLLVVLRDSALTDGLIRMIRSILRAEGNAMMVPAAVIEMTELPVTHSGKPSEAAATDALNGRPIGNRSALRNPDCLDGLRGKLLEHENGGKSEERHAVEISDPDLENVLIDICRNTLKVPGVSATDNFLALGGDSLSILGFLMEVAARTRTRVPLAELIGISTITNLAKLLRDGRVGQSGDDDAPQVRPVDPADKAEVCRLLDEGFSKPARDMPWEYIFDHPWQCGTIPRGFVLTRAGVIVGFIGMICAMRSAAGKSGPVCNLTAWFVRPAYRGWSAALLAAATSFEHLTYTSLTPGAESHRILKAIGFSEIGHVKRILPPLSHLATARSRVSIVFGSDISPPVDSENRRILADNQGFGCLTMMVTVGEQSALIIARRRFLGGYRILPYSEILYCSNPAVLKNHIELIKLRLMWRQRTLAMGVNDHVVAELSGGIAVSGRALFRSTLFAWQEIDRLYSEVALLPL